MKNGTSTHLNIFGKGGDYSTKCAVEEMRKEKKAFS
jgi:hypothetical protein